MSVQPMSAKRTLRQLAASVSACAAVAHAPVASTAAANAAIFVDFMVFSPGWTDVRRVRGSASRPASWE